MNKKRVLTSAILSSTLSATMIASPLVALSDNIVKSKFLVDNLNNATEFKYLYKDKYYNSYEDIVDSVMQQNSLLISKDLYYGDINKAIFDQESKRLNIAELRKFNHNEPSRLSEAWINVLGQHTMSFEEAKRSFINQGLIKYKYIDMFGNMFSSYQEADNSNKKNTKFNELVYYNLSDEKGDDIKINPLNKTDIDRLKELAINRVSQQLNKNIYNDNPFSYKIMKESIDLNSNVVNFDDVTNKLIFNWKIGKIKDDVNFIILKSMYEWINNLKVDVRVSLLNKNSHITHNYYLKLINQEQKDVIDYVEIVKSENNAGNSFSNDKRDLIIKGIKIKDLHMFEVFLRHKSYFESNPKSELLGIRTWSQIVGSVIKEARAAEAELTFKSKNLWDNENKDIKIQILCAGSGDASFGGNDTEILKNGTNYFLDYPQLFFSTKIINYDYNFDFSQNGFLNYIDSVLEEKENNKEYIEDLRNIINQIISLSKTKDNNLLNNIFINFKDSEYKNQFENFLKEYVKNDKASSTKKWIGFNDTSKTFFNKSSIQLLDSLSNLNTENIINSSILTRILSLIYDYTNLNNNFISSYKHFITYNNIPLFEIKTNKDATKAEYDLENNLLTSYVNYYINSLNSNNIDISNISSIDWKLKENQQNYFYSLTTNQPTYITSIEESIDSRKKLSIINQTNYEPFIEWRGSKENQVITINNGIFGAINSYNNNIINMDNVSYTKLISNNLFVRPEEILVLRNQYQEFSEAIYAKNLAQTDFSSSMFNPSISLGRNNDKIANNEFQQKLIANNFTKIQPSKIVVVYDITGKIINPGIGIDGVANTSNDALYDSEKNILDNLYRTTIIKKDPNMSYYRNDDGTYTLISNNVNWVYTLSWNNKLNYFTTFNDTKRYLQEMIKFETIKIKV